VYCSFLDEFRVWNRGTMQIALLGCANDKNATAATGTICRDARCIDVGNE